MNRADDEHYPHTAQKYAHHNLVCNRLYHKHRDIYPTDSRERLLLGLSLLSLN